MKENTRSTRTHVRLSPSMSGSRYSEMLVYIRYRTVSGSCDTDMWHHSCISIVSGSRDVTMWIVHSFLKFFLADVCQPVDLSYVFDGFLGRLIQIF